MAEIHTLLVSQCCLVSFCHGFPMEGGQRAGDGHEGSWGSRTHLPTDIPFAIPFFSLISVPVVPPSLVVMVRILFLVFAAPSADDVARLWAPRVADAVDGGGEPLQESLLLVIDGALVVVDRVCMVWWWYMVRLGRWQ